MKNLLEVMPDLNYKDIINMRNDLYQVRSCGGVSVADCSEGREEIVHLAVCGRDQTSSANKFRNKDILEGGGGKRVCFHWFGP